MRLVALGVRLDVAAVAQVLVDELALRSAHGVERHRPTEAQGLVGGVVGLAAQRLGPTLAVPLGVDLDKPALTRGAGDHAHREVLDRVDRLAVAADEEAEILAGELAADQFAVVVDRDLGVEAERVDELLEQLVEGFRGRRDGHQRRRPERFFFLRGGRGGAAAVEPPLTAAAAGAGCRERDCLAPSSSPELGLGFFSTVFPPSALGGGAPGWWATRLLMMYCW